MKKFRKPRCPHCGHKVGLLKTWTLRTQGEYLCPQCGKISNIVLDRLIYLFSFLAITISAIFFFLGFIGILSLDIWMILLVLLPFLLFYLISVFLVRLNKPPVRKRPIPPGARYKRPQSGPLQTDLAAHRR